MVEVGSEPDVTTDSLTNEQESRKSLKEYWEGLEREGEWVLEPNKGLRRESPFGDKVVLLRRLPVRKGSKVGRDERRRAQE